MKPTGMLLVAMVLASGQLMAQGSDARIVEEEALGKTLSLVSGDTLTSPEYPAAYASSGDDVCIAIGYSIKNDGTTGDYELLRVWSSDRKIAEANKDYLPAFADAAARTVSQWRYASLKAGALTEPVRTAATFEFKGKDGTRRLGDRCRVASLTRYYQAKGDIYPTGVSESGRRTWQSDLARSDSESYGRYWSSQYAPPSQTTP